MDEHEEGVLPAGTPEPDDATAAYEAVPVDDDVVTPTTDPAPAYDTPAAEPVANEHAVTYEAPFEEAPAAYEEPVTYEAPIEEAPAAYEQPTAAYAVFADPTPAEATFAAPAVAAPPVDARSGGAEAAEVVDAGDEEDEDDEKRGLSFATKALVVGAAWVLLVLFLIGQFSDGDDDPGAGPIGLDQTGEAADGEVAAGDEAAEEEPVDVDGDGEIEPGEPGYGSSSVAGAASGGTDDGSGGSTGGDGTGGGTSGGTGGGGEDGGSGEAAPVTLPGGAPAPTSTTTAKPGGSPSTTTTAKPGGGGGATTTTEAPSTTAPPPPPGTTAVAISGSCTFSRDVLTISSGSSVRFDNGTSSDVKVWSSSDDKHTVKAGKSYTWTFTSTQTVNCEKGSVRDTLVVTVT